MADYPQSPTYRGADWSWLANLPSEFYSGAQQANQYQEAQDFKGVPLNPDGTLNYAAMAQIAAKYGDVKGAPQLDQLGQQQQQSQEIRNTNLLDIQPVSPPNSGQPAPSGLPVTQTQQSPAYQPGQVQSAPLENNPPASAAASAATAVTGRSAASGGSQPAQGSETISQIVNTLPSLEGKPQVPANITKALTTKLGVSPDAPLTPEQQKYAQSVVDGYLRRKGMERMPNDGLLTRGLRNNNPGNIEDSPFTKSQPGYVGSEAEGRFAKFDTPENGLNAASNLLGRYAKGGIDTISGVISKWAPSSDGNNVANYTNFVAKQLGVDPNQPLNMSDPNVRRTVATAMAKFESGGTGTETGRSASQGAPQGQQQGQPLVPQFPLPPGFTDPQQAIMALREKAARYGAKYGSNPNADYNIRFWNGWADKIENSITPMKVGRYDSYVDPRTGKTVFDGAASGNSQVVQGIVDAIANGDQPPTLAGLYGQSAAVRAGLEKKGVNLANAQLQWGQAQKQVATLNGPQMTRFVGLASSVNSTIDEVRDLSEKMELSGIPLLNKAEIGAYIQTRGNTPNGQLAARYIAAVNTLKEEFANLAQGGYAPTESVWKLANNQINGDYGVKELGSSLDEVQRLIKYRVNAIPNLSTLGPGSANQYTGNTGQPQQSGGLSSGQGDTALNQARAAIAAGAPRDRVLQKLKDMGVDAGGL